MLLPSALGFSPHPPVSVYGTGTIRTIAAFLDAWLTYFPTRFRSHHAFGLPCGFSYRTPTSLARGFPFRAYALHTCPHSSVLLQYRNLNLLSIGYDSRPRLSTRLTQGRSAFTLETLDIRPRGFPTLSLATHSGILSSIHSTAPSGTASLRIQCSSTNVSRHSSASVSCFSPGHFRRRDLSTSELLRTL